MKIANTEFYSLVNGMFNYQRVTERIWTTRGHVCMVVLNQDGWRCGYIGYHQPVKAIRDQVVKCVHSDHKSSGNLSWEENRLPWEFDDEANWLTGEMVWFGLDYKDWGIDIQSVTDAFEMSGEELEYLRAEAVQYKINCPANEETVYQDLQDLSDFLDSANTNMQLSELRKYIAEFNEKG